MDSPKTFDDVTVTEIQLAAQELAELSPAQQLAWTSSLLSIYSPKTIEVNLKKLDDPHIEHNYKILLSDPQTARSQSSATNPTRTIDLSEIGSQITSASKITTRLGTSYILHCTEGHTGTKLSSQNTKVHGQTGGTENQQTKNHNHQITKDNTETQDRSVNPHRYAIFIEFDEDETTITNLEIGEDHSLDQLEDDTRRLQSQTLNLNATLEHIAQIWSSGHTHLDQTSQAAANMYFVRYHLQAAGHKLNALPMAHIDVDAKRGLDETELSKTNQSALNTLQSALGPQLGTGNTTIETSDGTGVTVDLRELTEVVSSLFYATDTTMSTRQRQGLVWLEWADWLGLTIGMARAKPPIVITGSTCVDWVNKCPEISSDIPADDREYAQWVFEIILQRLQDTGLFTTTPLVSSDTTAPKPTARTTKNGENTAVTARDDVFEIAENSTNHRLLAQALATVWNEDQPAND